MGKGAAIAFLLGECLFDPAIDEVAAEALWSDYRGRVEAIGPRPPAPPSSLPLSAGERGYAKRFDRFMSRHASDYTGVRKLDLRNVLVRQYYIVPELAARYAAATEERWLEEALPLQQRKSQLTLTEQSLGLGSRTEIELPHGDFIFARQRAEPRWQVAELLHNVTVVEQADRSILWAGYHRAFARMIAAARGQQAEALVAAARPAGSPAAPADAADAAYGPQGVCAARLADFDTEGLYLDVAIRRKRYVMRIEAKWSAIDESSGQVL